MISDIRVQQFRSYGDESFEFGPGVNIIVGPNASGKTNLLEAVLMIARGNSYRVKDAELVRFGAPWARIDAHAADDHERIVKLETTPSGVAKKQFELDGQKFVRLSLQKSLPVVIFEPNHLLLLTGSPEGRRSFLDDLLEQILPGYATTRRLYKRVVAQRNALLKKSPEQAKAQMFIWNLRMSELGGKIAAERTKLIDSINEKIGSIYQDIAKQPHSLVARYESPLSVEQYESDLLKKLETNFERDCLIGFTTNGPHRDDVQFLLNDHVADCTASRGETRSIILALKVIELQLLQSARTSPPLLLLDDVFSELDGVRRRALTAFLQDYQTFITTTDADVVVQHFIHTCNIIPLTKRA